MATPTDPSAPSVSASIDGFNNPHAVLIRASSVLTLKWTSKNAHTVRIEPLGEFGPSGTTQLPSAAVTYRLFAIDLSGAESDPYIVDVYLKKPDSPADPSTPAADLPPATDVTDAVPFGTLRTIPQPWNYRELRVWYPDSAKDKKVPLVLYLHGLVFSQTAHDGELMSTLPELKTNVWAMNVGNVAAMLVQSGKVQPIVIGAPSERPPERYSGAGWGTLHFGHLVDRAIDALEGTGVEIDLEQVCVCGWSAAGGHDGGLKKIGQDGGRFYSEKDQSHHVIKLMGIADCNSGGDSFSTALQKGFAEGDNTTTVVYAIQKDNGGWAGGGYVPPSNLKPFANAFGAKTDFGRPLPAANEKEDQDMFDVYLVDDKDDPKRIVARLKDGADGKKPSQKPGLYHHDDLLHKAQAIWRPQIDKMKAGASVDDLAGGRADAHKMVPLMWTFFALPKFFGKP